MERGEWWEMQVRDLKSEIWNLGFETWNSLLETSDPDLRIGDFGRGRSARRAGSVFQEQLE